MKVLFSSYLKYAGVLLCSSLLLFSCSKDDDSKIEPDPVDPIEETTQLMLSASAIEITEGDEIVFTITANGKAIKADIYIDDIIIDNTSYFFEEPGTFKVVAKKDNYINSKEIEIIVKEADYENNIYVVGWERGLSGEVAKYWKNGIAHELNFSANGNQTYAYSICVDNGDVFVGGSEYVNQNKVNAVVWKNGEIETWLEGGSGGITFAAHINSIYRYEGDLYATGTRKNGYLNNDINKVLGVGVYWKNGVAQEIGDEINNYSGSSISVNQNGVHIVGSGLDVGGYKAYYWNNNQIYIIDQSYQGYSVFTTDSDVYITGRGKSPSVEPVYWKNGIQYVMSGHTVPETVIVTDIFVDGDTTHTVGWKINSSSKNVALYWKNNVLQEMTNGTRNAQFNDVFVLGEDIYIAGYEYNNNSRKVAKYWKNGNPIELTDGTSNAHANGIFVVRERKNERKKHVQTVDKKQQY